METRLKERLTGAAILVALIVMLVPEMFRGEGDHEIPPGAAATSASGGAEGPPLRSYTIDLSNNPKGAAPLQSTGDASAASSRSESAHTDVPKAEAPKAEAPRAQPTGPEATRGESPKAEPKAGMSKGEPAKEGIREAAASTVPPKPTAAASTASRPGNTGNSSNSSNSSNSGNWTVQLGLFAKRENAERLATELKAKGFNVAITGADPKGLFHVHTAGTSDRASAQGLAQRLKGEGFAAAVVAP